MNSSHTSASTLDFRKTISERSSLVDSQKISVCSNLEYGPSNNSQSAIPAIVRSVAFNEPIVHKVTTFYIGECFANIITKTSSKSDGIKEEDRKQTLQRSEKKNDLLESMKSHCVINDAMQSFEEEKNDFGKSEKNTNQHKHCTPDIPQAKTTAYNLELSHDSQTESNICLKKSINSVLPNWGEKKHDDTLKNDVSKIKRDNSNKMALISDNICKQINANQNEILSSVLLVDGTDDNSCNPDIVESTSSESRYKSYPLGKRAFLIDMDIHNSSSDYKTAVDIESPLHGSTEFISALSTFDSSQEICSDESLQSLNFQSDFSSDLGNTALFDLTETLVASSTEADISEKEEDIIQEDDPFQYEHDNRFSNETKTVDQMKKSKLKRCHEMIYMNHENQYQRELNICYDDKIIKYYNILTNETINSTKSSLNNRVAELTVSGECFINLCTNLATVQIKASDDHSIKCASAFFKPITISGPVMCEFDCAQRQRMNNQCAKYSSGTRLKRTSVACSNHVVQTKTVDGQFDTDLLGPESASQFVSLYQEKLSRTKWHYKICEEENLFKSNELGNKTETTHGPESIIKLQQRESNIKGEKTKISVKITTKNQISKALAEPLSSLTFHIEESEKHLEKIINEQFKKKLADLHRVETPNGDVKDDVSLDSFEIITKPDLTDEFFIVEEVGTEADEEHCGGKCIVIQQTKILSEHDEEVGQILVQSARTEINLGYQIKTGIIDLYKEENILNTGNETAAEKTCVSDPHNRRVGIQLTDNEKSYTYEIAGGILEDIKEEDAEFDTGTSLIHSFADSISSTPEKSAITAESARVRGDIGDQVCSSSLQEFESLEQAISLENRNRYQQGSTNSSHGSFECRFMQTKKDPDTTQSESLSVSSLKEFEILENACFEAILTEVKAKEEAQLLLHSDNNSRINDANSF